MGAAARQASQAPLLPDRPWPSANTKAFRCLRAYQVLTITTSIAVRAVLDEAKPHSACCGAASPH